jgi:hypothetical protein
MLFSLNEKGQGVAEFIGGLLLLLVILLICYAILQHFFFPNWTPVYKLFG